MVVKLTLAHLNFCLIMPLAILVILRDPVRFDAMRSIFMFRNLAIIDTSILKAWFICKQIVMLVIIVCDTVVLYFNLALTTRSQVSVAVLSHI